MKSYAQIINENAKRRTICVYGGKFQPFHDGHYEIYEQLVRVFGRANVFICTNDINISKRARDAKYRENHALTFDEKRDVMTTMFNVPKQNVVLTKRVPFMPAYTELAPYVGSGDVAIVTVAGGKDDTRFASFNDATSNKNVATFVEFDPRRDDIDELQSSSTTRYYAYFENKRVKRSATEVRRALRTTNDDERRKYFIDVYKRFDERIYTLLTNRFNNVFESHDNASSHTINEGGVCGHITHVYNDLTLTFDDVDAIIDDGFNNRLADGVEKVDGQPLAMTRRDNQFLFAYKSSMKTRDALRDEFMSDLPRNVYSDVCDTLIRVFSKHVDACASWFGQSGERALHLEVISASMPNMIHYNRDCIVMHYVVTYDEKGKVVKRDRELADEIAREIASSCEGERYVVIAPPRLRVRDIDYTNVMTKLHNDVDKLRSRVTLYDKNVGVTLFDFLNSVMYTSLGVRDLDAKRCAMLTKRALGLNKTHEINARNYPDDAMRAKIEKSFTNAQRDVNRAYNELRVVITKIGVEIIRGIEHLVAFNPDEGRASMRRVLNDGIAHIERSNGFATSQALADALSRIRQLDDDALEPSEGIIFVRNGRLYKITGAFADYAKLSQDLRTMAHHGEYEI